MEIKEAINKIREHYRTVSMCATTQECRDNNEAIIIAVRAMGKQVPVILDSDNKLGYHKCKCGVYFEDEHFDGYCGKCGQRIRW